MKEPAGAGFLDECVVSGAGVVFKAENGHKKAQNIKGERAWVVGL